MEQFKTIPGFENYAVSNEGRIQRLTSGPHTKPGRFKKPQVNTKNGYCHVKVSGSEGKKSILLHRLVAQAFLPNPLGYKEIDHIDRDKTNNHVDNLRWCTREENMANRKNGIQKPIVAQGPDETEWRVYKSLREAAREIAKETGMFMFPQGIYNTLRFPLVYPKYKGWKFKYFGSED